MIGAALRERDDVVEMPRLLVANALAAIGASVSLRLEDAREVFVRVVSGRAAATSPVFLLRRRAFFWIIDPPFLHATPVVQNARFVGSGAQVASALALPVIRHLAVLGRPAIWSRFLALLSALPIPMRAAGSRHDDVATRLGACAPPSVWLVENLYAARFAVKPNTALSLVRCDAAFQCGAQFGPRLGGPNAPDIPCGRHSFLQVGVAHHGDTERVHPVSDGLAVHSIYRADLYRRLALSQIEALKGLFVRPLWHGRILPLIRTPANTWQRASMFMFHVKRYT